MSFVRTRPMKVLTQTFLVSFAALALASCAAEGPLVQGDAGVLDMTLPEISEKLAAGTISSEKLTGLYLARISDMDRAGPQLNAFIALNPQALSLARQSDARRSAGETLGPLDGIPVGLKDNIETSGDMATTAGAYALKDNLTGRDSPLAAGLKAEGAIVLGKTNLSQWANFRSAKSSSGWSALGGQVKNPHILNRNPCGSSSGTGAAVAASMIAGGVGTETNGSVICPAAMNGIVGFKPTVGLVAQDYIVPISVSQDTAGPMTKSVRGAAMMLGAMAGDGMDYTAELDERSLSGIRLGVLNFSLNDNEGLNRRFLQALAVLEAKGAILVRIDTFEPDTDDFWDKALSVLHYEFKDGIDDYMANAAPTVQARSLADVIAFNTANAKLELEHYDQALFEISEAKGDLTSADYLSALSDIQKATRQAGIDRLLGENNLSALIAPSGPVSPERIFEKGDDWPDWAGAGYLAAIAGYPHLTVPMGVIDDIPVGLSFMGAKDSDAQMLSYGYAYEQASKARVTPKYLSGE